MHGYADPKLSGTPSIRLSSFTGEVPGLGEFSGSPTILIVGGFDMRPEG
jgi:hypothetical protein